MGLLTRKTKEQRQGAKVPEGFGPAVEYCLENHPDGHIHIYRKDKSSNLPAELGKMTYMEADAHKDDIYASLRAMYGGGQYTVKFFKANTKILTTQMYILDGPSKRGEGSSSDPDRRRSSASEKYDHLMEKLLEKAIDGNGSGNLSGFMEKMVSVLMDNHFAQRENVFGNIVDGMEALKAMAPTIPAQDPMVELVTAIAPSAAQVLTGLLNAKAGSHSQQGGLPQVAAGQQIQALLSNPKVQAFLQQNPDVLSGIASQTQTVSLPGPGETIPNQHVQPTDIDNARVNDRAMAVSDEEPVVSDKPAPHIPPGASAMDPDHVTFAHHIEILRTALREGKEALVIAQHIVSLVQASKILTPTNPHPILAGLTNLPVESDPSMAEREVDRFFAAIPEIANDSDRQAKIKLILTAPAGLEDEQQEEAEDQPEKQDVETDLSPAAAGVHPGASGDRGTATEQQSQPDSSEAGGEVRAADEDAQAQVA